MANRVNKNCCRQNNYHERQKAKKYIRSGPDCGFFIGDSIQKHNTKTEIGGHSIFLGQVRADTIDEKKVSAIEYTAYEEMALEKMH